jgi:hypothetical protein
LNNKIFFEEVIASNDVLFSIRMANAACSIHVVDNAVYCVTLRRNSLIHTESYELLLSRYLVYLRANKFLRKMGGGKFQFNTKLFIYLSTKYGIIPLFHFIRLSIRYRNNPFMGICNFQWIYNYLRMRKYRRKNDKYFIRE